MKFTPARMLFVFGLAALSTGCTPTKPIYLNDTGDLSSYIEQATAIEYPDVETRTLDEVTQSYAPITVTDPDFQSYEDIRLEEAVGYALQNGKVFRGYGTASLQGTRVSPGVDNLINNVNAAGTIYDVAIRESEPGFIGTPGQISSPGSISTNTGLDVNQGVEAALADFDAQYTSSLTYQQSDEPRNTVTSNPNLPLVFQQDSVQFTNEVAKKSANGTQLFFRNVTNYTDNSNPLVTDNPPGFQVLDSVYRTAFEAEVRQPLLRGRGAFINRMPIVISRISTDQQIANLEAQLQNFVTNVEIRYWDLYLAYRSLDAAKTGRDAAVETWRIVKDQYDEGSNVNIQQVAQAAEQYHFFDAQVIDSYNSVLNAEGALRFLLGWASTDGRILRPVDEPVMAPVEFDWCNTLCEALTYRPELRQERWEIKKRELALAYSKNGLLPELNVSGTYRWLGNGNKFGASGESGAFPTQNSGALNQLYGGNFQELALSGEFRMPIGFRRELANVRNAQLKLAREIARLEDSELEISKELSEAFRALQANQAIMQSSYNRWKETTIEKDHFEELEIEGVETLDVALDAQRRRSQAEIAFYTAVSEYNKVIALIHRRKGTALAHSGIEFSEGAWPGKAYKDAQEHARRRGASRELDYGFSRPNVISRGYDSPSNYNNGRVIGSPENGAAYPIQSEVMYESESMYDGQMIEGPIYNDPYVTPGDVIETMPGESLPPIMRAPQDQNGPGSRSNLAPQSRTRRQSRHANRVQQVSYETDIMSSSDVRDAAVSRRTQAATQTQSPTPSRRQTVARQTSEATHKPSVTRSNVTRSNGTREKLSTARVVKPQRDSNPTPATRLSTKTNARVKQSNKGSTMRVIRATTGQPTQTGSASKDRNGNVDWRKMGFEHPPLR